jgi:hypothetical protein
VTFLLLPFEFDCPLDLDLDHHPSLSEQMGMETSLVLFFEILNSWTWILRSAFVFLMTCLLTWTSSVTVTVIGISSFDLRCSFLSLLVISISICWTFYSPLSIHDFLHAQEVRFQLPPTALFVCPC